MLISASSILHSVASLAWHYVWSKGGATLAVGYVAHLAIVKKDVAAAVAKAKADFAGVVADAKGDISKVEAWFKKI